MRVAEKWNSLLKPYMDVGDDFAQWNRVVASSFGQQDDLRTLIDDLYYHLFDESFERIGDKDYQYALWGMIFDLLLTRQTK